MNQSTILHCLRGLAALTVVLGHIRNHLFQDYKEVVHPSVWFKIIAFASGFGGQAVIVFFVMSGWLVGGRFLKTPAEDRSYVTYFIDRISRLWTVLLPLFLLHMYVQAQAGVVFSDATAGSFSVTIMVGNLFGLQTVWVPNFGGNYPLWSLANETAYYTLFPLITIWASTQFSSRIRLIAFAVMIIYGLILPIHIVQYFSIWLLGIGGSMIRLRGWFMKYFFGVALVTFAIFLRVERIDGMLLADIMLAVCFTLFLSSVSQTQTAPNWLRRLAVWLASFSFTLYVAHVPVVQALQHISHVQLGMLNPSDSGSLLYFGAFFALVVLTCYVLYLGTEAHTTRIRQLIRILVQTQPA